MSIYKNYLEYFKDNPNGYWFKRKLYGWGWTPVKWQGWLTIFVWAIFFTIDIMMFDHEWVKNLLFAFLSIGVLLYICYKKGEKPGWQWGPQK